MPKNVVWVDSSYVFETEFENILQFCWDINYFIVNIFINNISLLLCFFIVAIQF